jgi:thioesterase domain-containing protein
VVGLHCPMYYTPGGTPRPSLSQVATRYVDAIRSKYPKGPYALAGLCFGGVVAFEVARMLLDLGEEVPLLAIFDSVLPRGRHTNWTKRISHHVLNYLRHPSAEFNRAEKVASDFLRPRLQRSPKARSSFAMLGFSAEPAHLGPVDLPVDGPEGKADVAEFAAARRCVDTKLLVFRALQNGIPDWAEIDKDMGWGGKATSVEAFSIDCEHLKIVRPPFSREVAAIIMRKTGGSQGRGDGRES